MLIFFLWASIPSWAQKETNIWVLTQQTVLDFNFDPPKVIKDGEVKSYGTDKNVFTMADKNGRLLFFSDGFNVYSRNGAVMPNGSSLVKPALQSVTLVPKPESPFEYYVITSEGDGDRGYMALKYAVVDMRLNGGMGDVTRKGATIGAYHDVWTTVAGNCDGSVFWIIISKINPAGFHAFKIDKHGVSSTPVVSSLPIYTTRYRVSPKGDRIVWKEYGAPGFFLGDFSVETGQVTGRKYVPSPTFQTSFFDEFSSDGHMFYTLSEETPGEKQLLQFDLGSGDPATIARSKFLISKSRSNPMTLQLASNGKVYVQYYNTGLNEKYLNVIHSPNAAGAGCHYDPTPIPIGHAFRLPNFVTTFLQEHGPSGIPAQAGADAPVCQGQPLRLGDPAADPTLTYRWSPAAHLSDPSSPSPAFTYAEAVTDSVKILTYALTVSRGNCVNTDTVRVRVYPLPTATLTGPRSVCPRVEGVEYRVEEPKPGHAYSWRVSGGTLTQGQGTASIKVNWGPTNPDAWVEVVATSGRGCEGPPTRLPVRVNVELIPETPRGPDSVCVNQSQGITYRVTNTPGSIYTWFLEDGTLASGQGTSRVTVDWGGEGQHRLWLQERSTTADTVCFGLSEPLLVSVYQDRTRLELAYVSVGLQDERVVEAVWSSTDPARLTGPLVLFRRRQGESAWQAATTLPRGSTSHSDPGRRTDEEVYEYRVETLNGCEEVISSGPHATVLLRGEGREEDGQISLSWSGYEGWPQGVERYEVWRRLDGEEGLKQVGQVSGSTLSFDGASGLDGFAHSFRVKAIARGTGHASWSNELDLNFAHELTVPNIFTPNGDGYNDTFVIPLLELYPDNQLTVYSRWGQQVFRAEGYRNGWAAESLSAGTYYYSLLLRRTGKLLKGWVEVVR